MSARVHRWLRQARQLLGWSRDYVVGGVPLKLPAEHLLPEYQKAHPLYDRFLPHLAAELLPGDAVIDVGANVGDTVAALLAGQTALEVLAVEADAGFFSILQCNAERLRQAYPQAVLHSRLALIGQGAQRLALVGSGGTRRAVASEEATAQASVTLDNLAHTVPASFAERLRLVKSDVDGWDADVIMSALPLLQRWQPLVYMECQVGDAASRETHLHCLRALQQAGYVDIHVFDNFGAWWKCTQRVDDVDACIDEVLAPVKTGQPRRAHYLDLLLAAPRDAAMAMRAVARHAAQAAAPAHGAREP